MLFVVVSDEGSCYVSPLWPKSQKKSQKKKKYTVFSVETPKTVSFICEGMQECILLCVTVRPSSLPHRNMLPSGCSCKTYNQESALCCRECRPLSHKLRRKQRNTESVWWVSGTHILKQPIQYSAKRKGQAIIQTYLAPSKQSPDSYWCLSRCHVDTGETWSHSRTCLFHKFHNTNRAGCSMLS